MLQERTSGKPEVLCQTGKFGPHYKHITDLAKKHGIELVSLDCDGLIDTLVPIWLENGVNVMFPIEVGTWDASIAPWREQYGKQLRGVGGMRKYVLALDYAAVDAEVDASNPWWTWAVHSLPGPSTPGRYQVGKCPILLRENAKDVWLESCAR